MTKRLGLERETLAELCTGELTGVVGGAAPESLRVDCVLPPVSGHTCVDCLTRWC